MVGPFSCQTLPVLALLQTTAGNHIFHGKAQLPYKYRKKVWNGILENETFFLASYIILDETIILQMGLCVNLFLFMLF